MNGKFSGHIVQGRGWSSGELGSMLGRGLPRVARGYPPLTASMVPTPPTLRRGFDSREARTRNPQTPNTEHRTPNPGPAFRRFTQFSSFSHFSPRLHPRGWTTPMLTRAIYEHPLFLKSLTQRQKGKKNKKYKKNLAAILRTIFSILRISVSSPRHKPSTLSEPHST